MKRYPSIRQGTRAFDAWVFDKIDGSNLRFEWTRQHGWHRFGTRTRVVEPEHLVYGCAWPLFLERFAEPIERLAVDLKWQSVVAFAEFWGEHSFAGRHLESDDKRLTLFDVAVHKRGLIEPSLFLNWFGRFDVPRFLGQMCWDEALVRRVRAGELAGITCEGVVGKGMRGKKLVMAKAKTQAWIDAVVTRFGVEEGGMIANS